MEILKRLTGLYTDITLYRKELGTTYNTMSDIERRHGDKSEALDLAQKARELFEQLVADNPNDASHRRNLAQSYTSLGRLQTQAANLVTALRSFQHAIDLLESLHELNAKDSYRLACNLALCIALITRNSVSQNTPQQLGKGDRLRCQLYGDRAIESLRRSFNGGFLNARILEDETDLASLHSRADFKNLVKEIEEAPPQNGKED